MIIGLTLIISCTLHLLIDKKFKNKSMQTSKIITFALIILIGFIIIISQKDHSAEMQELEDKLSENSKIIEEKNQEFINSKNSENIEEQTLK